MQLCFSDTKRSSVSVNTGQSFCFYRSIAPAVYLHFLPYSSGNTTLLLCTSLNKVFSNNTHKNSKSAVYDHVAIHIDCICESLKCQIFFWHFRTFWSVAVVACKMSFWNLWLVWPVWFLSFVLFLNNCTVKTLGIIWYSRSAAILFSWLRFLCLFCCIKPISHLLKGNILCSRTSLGVITV